MKQWTGSKLRKEYIKAIYCHCVYLIYMQVHHVKYWTEILAGWILNCNQDHWEKYQQPQICRWYHSNGRKRRGTKESLDEGERGEWKGWFKIQLSKNEDHGIQSHHLMANRRGKSRSSNRFFFFPWIPLLMVTTAMKLKDACSLEGKLWQI